MAESRINCAAEQWAGLWMGKRPRDLAGDFDPWGGGGGAARALQEAALYAPKPFALVQELRRASARAPALPEAAAGETCGHAPTPKLALAAPQRGWL
jgi:hypothetical protein